MAYASDIQTHRTNIIDRVAAILKGAVERFVQYRMYRKTVRELQVLSTRELDDLGLSHSMIKRVALEAAYGL